MVDLSVTETSSTFCKSCFNSEIAWPPGFRSKKPWSFTGFPVITTALAPALVVGCPVKARWLPGRQLEEIPFESLAEEWQQNLPQPLVGNEGMKFYMLIMGIHSLIPYKGQPEKQTIVTCWWTWIPNEAILCYSTKPLYSRQTTPFLPATIMNRLIWGGPIILSSHIHQPSLSIWVIGASVTSNFTVQKIPVIQVMLASDSEFTTGPSIRKRQDSCRHTTWKPTKMCQKTLHPINPQK